jgi:hypothetical protein
VSSLIRRLITFTVSAGLLVCLPGQVSAQAFGLGPRMSWVRAHVPTATPAGRFVGGTLRMRASKRTTIELAMDYRSETNIDSTVKMRETPFQGSLLIYPVRAAVSPYLIGGYGIYKRKFETLGSDVATTLEDRKTGWHIGLGGELMIGRHAGFYVDYRYRFVKFGLGDDGAEEIDVPGLSALNVSHQGSMWTSGIAFYF